MILTPVQMQLGRGRHASPGDRGCLMELASVLAGETWGDHPASVQPVLAAVARVVNDRVGEQDRARLEQLVPAMIGTAADDIDSYARLVLICSAAALNEERVRSHPDVRAEVESARRMAQRALSATSRNAAVGDRINRRTGPGSHGQPVVPRAGQRRGSQDSPGGGGRTGAFIGRLLASSPTAQRWYRRTAVRQATLSASAMAGAGPSDRVALCELLRACVLALQREPELASIAGS
jgi:hypothetical protein